MIWFNGVELDYNKGILDKLVIKKALTDVESLSDRKGTNSTKFSLPRTATNEAAFGFITTDGSQATPSGTGLIYLDGNLYSQGTIHLRGYDDKNINVVFFGSDVDLINALKSKKLKEVIAESSVGLWSGAYNYYADGHVRLYMDTILSSQVDHYFAHPQGGIRDATLPTMPQVAPHFDVNSLIEKIFTDEGYEVVSDFMTKDYATYLGYSNYDGEHLSSTFLLSATTNFTTLGGYIDLGNVSLGDSITKTAPDKFVIANNIEKLRLSANFTIAEDTQVGRASIQIRVMRDVAAVPTIFYNSLYTVLEVGDNTINMSVDSSFLANDYIQVRAVISLNEGETLPINYDINVSNCVITTDNIQAAGTSAVRLRDYLGNGTQYEFLANYIKHHNLVMDIEGDKVYLECQDAAIMHVGLGGGSTLDTTTGIATETIDISADISKISPVKFENNTKEYIFLSQKMQNTIQTSEISIKQYQTLGSSFYRLNSYGKDVETYSTDFTSVFGGVDNFTSLGLARGVALELVEDWENFINNRLDFFGTWGDTGTYNYMNLDTSTTSINVFATTNQTARIGAIAFGFGTEPSGLFRPTLEQRESNKVREIELYDNTGTLINFRKDYIINDQLYKLIEYEFEPVSKKVKAKIIMK